MTDKHEHPPEVVASAESINNSPLTNELEFQLGTTHLKVMVANIGSFPNHEKLSWNISRLQVLLAPIAFYYPDSQITVKIMATNERVRPNVSGVGNETTAVASFFQTKVAQEPRLQKGVLTLFIPAYQIFENVSAENGKKADEAKNLQQYSSQLEQAIWDQLAQFYSRKLLDFFREIPVAAIVYDVSVLTSILVGLALYHLYVLEPNGVEFLEPFITFGLWNTVAIFIVNILKNVTAPKRPFIPEHARFSHGVIEGLYLIQQIVKEFDELNNVQDEHFQEAFTKLKEFIPESFVVFTRSIMPSLVVGVGAVEQSLPFQAPLFEVKR